MAWMWGGARVIGGGRGEADEEVPGFQKTGGISAGGQAGAVLAV